MFALDSSVRVRFINQQRVVDKLLGHFFHVSKTSTKASLMSYRNQTAIEIKFNQKNIENFDDLGLPIRMMKGVKDSNTTKPNFNNVLKTALQEFKESEKHSENSKYDIKTLVIFTHGATIIPNNEMTRLKKEFAKLMVKILVIGLAENLQREHLAKLASNRGYVIIADSSFTLINDTYRQVKIANLICRGKLTMEGFNDVTSSDVTTVFGVMSCRLVRTKHNPFTFHTKSTQNFPNKPFLITVN